MVTTPKTAPTHLTVGEARARLADPHVHMVLLVDSRCLKGTLTRDDIPEIAVAQENALSYAHLDGRVIGPSVAADDARAAMSRVGRRRLAVVGEADMLIGLLCLKGSHRGFCSDTDVSARRLGEPRR